MVAVNVRDYIVWSQNIKGIRQCNKQQIGRIGCYKPDYYSTSFFPATINMWNYLPETVVSQPTLSTFKTAVSKVDVITSSHDYYISLVTTHAGA